MKQRVTVNDLLVAADWLDCNEGEGGEAEACNRVARLLVKMAEQRDQKAERRGVYARP